MAPLSTLYREAIYGNPAKLYKNSHGLIIQV